MLLRPNLLAALKRVRSNKGSPGMDGMTVGELADHLRANWDAIRERWLSGTCQPSPVKEALIPKGKGEMRRLGIPTVLDRFIQQALLQVLQPLFDPTLSRHSYGFRPGRSSHEAIRAAQRHIQEGKRWVVDTDLETFFDRVNHDVLIGRLAARISDRRVLGLIRRYLKAGCCPAGWRWNGTRARRRAGPCHRFWPMCCWTRWTGNGKAGATPSSAARTTAASMCEAVGPGNG
jgi:group II intron reverse transcriptase/maturase